MSVRSVIGGENCFGRRNKIVVQKAGAGKWVVADWHRSGIRTSTKRRTESRRQKSSNSSARPTRCSATRSAGLSTIAMEPPTALTTQKLTSSWTKYSRCSFKAEKETHSATSTTSSRCWRATMTNAHAKCSATSGRRIGRREGEPVWPRANSRASR